MSNPASALIRARPSHLALSAFFRQQHCNRHNATPIASLQLRRPTFAVRSLRLTAVSRDTGSPTNRDASITGAIKKTGKQKRDELLAATSSFLKRLAIRFRWFAIRGFRPYRVDDWSAFFSWVLGGVGVWFVVGTTSFIASIFYLLNSLQMQEWLGTRLGNYLTASSGVRVVFESAIVPSFSWRDSKISFKNVYIYRGPEKLLLSKDGAGKYKISEVFDQTKGLLPSSSGEDRAETPADPQTPRNPSPFGKVKGRLANIFSSSNPNVAKASEGAVIVPETFDEKRMMAFHLSIDSIDVALSFPRWLDGKGIVKEAVVKGVRGVIDRSQIVYDKDAVVDRFAFRHAARPGDFCLESLIIEDFLVTIRQPNSFRPYTFSIFNANIPKLRKQWLFYDLLASESITGQIDNCLFSLHRPQSIGRTNTTEEAEMSSDKSKWCRISRFRIDGINIDHLQSPHDTGALAWITSGKCDLVADIRFPRLLDDESLEAIIGNIVDRFDEVVLQSHQKIPGQKELSGGRAIQAPSPVITMRRRLGLDDAEVMEASHEACVSLDLGIRFKEIKASLPLFPPDLSYINYALIRPIVAFLNANRTLIPIKCQVDMPMSDFDGSWTTYDTGLLDAISAQVYEALAHHVRSHNDVRAKQVGLWTLQTLSAKALNALRTLNEREIARAETYSAI